MRRVILHVDQDGVLAEYKNCELKDLYEKGYFLNLKKNENVPEGIELFMKKYPQVEVELLSCYLSDRTDAIEEKVEWLKDNMPYFYGHAKLVFIPFGEKKSKVVEGSEVVHILLDDHSPNLLEFSQVESGYGIKVLNDNNGEGKKWKGMAISSKLPPETFAEMLYTIISEIGGVSNA